MNYNNSTIKQKGFVFICFFISCFLQSFSAQVTVTGTVTSNQDPIPGVTVSVKGTSAGTQTDFDGKYSITVDSNATLVFSYIGLKSKEEFVGSRTKIDVQLNESVEALDEIIVVGYGSQKKKDLVGSVTQISSEDIEDLQFTSVDQALVGQTAGVQFRQTGNPGAGPQILIRGISSLGNNAPLYVIDGVPLTNVGNSQDNFLLNFINPEDVESISILRDANAKAIYGNRGSNGVIIITTKKGKKGKSRIQFSTYSTVGWVQDFDKPNNLNALEMAIFQKERLEDRYLFNGGWGGLEQAHYTRIQQYISDAETDPSLVKGTNWFDEITRESLTNDYHLSFSGGSENITYNISGGYRHEEGVVIDTDLKRLTLRANIEAKVNNWLKVGANISPSFVTNNNADTEPNSGGYSAYSSVNASYWVDPTAPVFDENGNLTPSTFGILSRQNFQGNPIPNGSGMFWTTNPVSRIRLREQESKTNTWLATAFIEVEPIKDLKIRSTVGLNQRYRRTFNYTPKFLPLDGLTPDITGRPNSGSAAGMEETTNFNFDNQLTYNKTFNENHNFEFTTLLSIERRKVESNFLSASGFADEDLIFPSASNVVLPQDFNGNYAFNDLNRIGLIGRLSYNYASKYYIEGSFRRDASSRFSQENRWGNFYAFNTAWRVSEEPFWKPLKDKITNLRLELGYGVTGNDAGIGNYAWQGNVGRLFYSFGNDVLAAGYGINSLPNELLTWEESQELNLGLDIGLFNKFNLEIDYYDIESSGFLGSTPIPTATGFGGIINNVGSIANRGVEISLSSLNLVNTQGGFKYNFNANVSFNKNEVLDLGGDGEIFIGQAGNGTQFSVLREGDPIGIFRGFKILGFYSQEDLDNPDVAKYPEAVVGSAKIFDGNGDGKIEFSAADYVDLGDANPEITFGMQHNFSYRNFDLSILINGATGFQIYDQRSQQMHNLDGQFNVDREVLTNRYRPGVPQDIVIPATANLPNGAVIRAREETPLNSITIPTTKQNTTRYWRAPNSFHIKDADYLWVRNITLGYNLTQKFLGENSLVSGARIYMSVQNPFVFSKYDLGSPEVQRNSDNLVRGVNEGSYPNSRTVTLGLNLNF